MDIEKETDVLSDIANFFGLKPKDMSPSKVVMNSSKAKKDKKKHKKSKKHHSNHKSPFQKYLKKTKKYSKNGNDYTETYTYPEATQNFTFKRPSAADMKGVHYHEIDRYATSNVSFPR
jgi:hypothetical protein